MELLLTGNIPCNGKEDDAGRSKSRRPLQKNDCAVRALALGFELDYDVAYDYYMEQGRKSHRGFHLQKLLDKYSKSGQLLFGKKVVRHSFPAEKGVERMYVSAFCNFHPKGIYITRQAGHVATVIDGTVHDLNLSVYAFERCVYKAFEIVEVPDKPKFVKCTDGSNYKL